MNKDKMTRTYAPSIEALNERIICNKEYIKNHEHWLSQNDDMCAKKIEKLQKRIVDAKHEMAEDKKEVITKVEVLKSENIILKQSIDTLEKAI